MLDGPPGSWRTTFDWHRASGLWLWPALLVVAVTSVSLNLYKEVFSPLLTRMLPVEWPMPGKQRLVGAWAGYDAAVACGGGEARRIGRELRCGRSSASTPRACIG